MKFRTFAVFITLLCVTIGLSAQKKSTKDNKTFRLEVEIPQGKNNIAYLLKYWNASTYIQDSIPLSDKGIGVFTANEALPEGQYVIYIKPDFQLDILLGNEPQNLKLLVSDDIINSTISGSKDTKVLWQYIRSGQDHSEKVNELTSKLDNDKLSSEERKTLEQHIATAKEHHKGYINSLIKNNQGKWVSTYLKGMQPITSYPIKDIKTQADIEVNRAYAKNHFFDNIDLKDPRFLRTNYFDTYLDHYMEYWVGKDLDSMTLEASKLVTKTKGNDICFEYMLSRFVNNSITSNRMGMENIWSKLAEDYIFDKTVSWIDSTQHSELKKKYELIKNNRIGMTAHSLPLSTIDGKEFMTNDIEAEYTILYFFDPACSQCRVNIPLIKDNIYDKYRDKGLKIITINVTSNIDGGIDFVKTFELTDWVNAWDPKFETQFWTYYNTSGVPSIYLLDKNKKIIAKDLSEKSLEDVFNIIYKENGTN